MSLSALGVDRWEHDVWYRIVEAALAGKPNVVKLDDLPGFDRPAVSRYAATTPALLQWFRHYNADRPYREQVRPFGFLLAYHPKSGLDLAERQETVRVGATRAKRTKRRARREDTPRAVAPFNRDHKTAAAVCFDRKTGVPVDVAPIQSYREALLRFHLHPEAKFGNGEWFDRGETTRRHIRAEKIVHIGKDVNRWEEQFHLGADPEAQTEYCSQKADLKEMEAVRARQVLNRVQERRTSMGLREIARHTGLHHAHLSEALTGKRMPSTATVSRLERWVDEQAGAQANDSQVG